MVATIIRSGAKEGVFRRVDPAVTGRAVLHSTLRFHHPFHADEWASPTIDADYEAVWNLLMEGLRATKSSKVTRG